MPYKQFLGCKKGDDNIPEIVEKEAKTIRLIYKLFLEGKTPSGISRYLTDRKIKTPGGKDKWLSSTIASILKNEKYMGCAMLQKSYTVDFLTKKKKVNEGEIPQYYVANSHPEIITPEIFEMAQEEFRRRKAAGKCTSAINCFASRIVCGDCGGFYGRKVWHSNTKYANTVWQCNNKFQKRKFCRTPHLKEEAIKKAFVEAFNSLIENKEEIIAGYDEIIEKLTDFSKQERERLKIDEECALLEKTMEKLIYTNAQTLMDQNKYNKKYGEHVAHYKSLQKRRQEISLNITQCKAKKNLIIQFIKDLRKQEHLLAEFNEGLWSLKLNSMIIISENEALFKFKDGTELPRSLK
ncbi:MAG: recombinase family protein [Clostridiaceae bacterium]